LAQASCQSFSRDVVRAITVGIVDGLDRFDRGVKLEADFEPVATLKDQLYKGLAMLFDIITVWLETSRSR
jgi:hypothetical protein